MSLPGLRPAFALLPQLSKLAPWQNTVLGTLRLGHVEGGAWALGYSGAGAAEGGRGSGVFEVGRHTLPGSSSFPSP